MLDPFTTWSRMLGAAARAATTGRQVSETLSASQEVISRRTGMMQSPLTADYVELGRMVPEKIEAFSKAGVAVATEWWAMQAECFAEAQHIAAIAMRGRPPSLDEWTTLASRNRAHALRMVERSVALGASAVAPIHRSATGNARRLRASARRD
jgi:hypothetical protein